MKIAFAIENFSPHGGGAESYAVSLADRMVSEGWEAHLFGHEWHGAPEAAIFHKIPRLPKWVPPSVRILHFALMHRKAVRGFDFDVTVGFGNTISMNVYQSHGGVHDMSSSRKLKAVSNPALRLLKACAMWLSPKYHARRWIESAAFRIRPRPIVIAISDMVRKDMAERFSVDEESIRLVYNGIDVARFRDVSRSGRAGLRERLGFSEETLFLFMAYDFRKKGVKDLIEAAGALKRRVGEGKFGVVVVGNQPSPSLRRLVQRLELGSSVVFPGPTKAPETYYGACDVFVLPTYYDACSLVVFEAMAAGLPAITTVFNGAAGIISHGKDGMILRNPGDSLELADSMEAFLDPAALGRCAREAELKAQQYTLERNHGEMIAIFREAAERKRTRSGPTSMGSQV